MDAERTDDETLKRMASKMRLKERIEHMERSLAGLRQLYDFLPDDFWQTHPEADSELWNLISDRRL